MIALSKLRGARWLVPAALLISLHACSRGPDSGGDAVAADDPQGAEEERPMGLTVQGDGVAPGYVLYSPLTSGTTYLLDTEARVVHTWDSDYSPHSLYLLEDGSLLRPGRDPDAEGFQAGGAMGLVEKYTWDGERTWFWKLSDERQILHHDIEPLPGGNFLAIGWELVTREEALAAGRRPELIPEEGLWVDFVAEVEPVPPDRANIVWRWRVMDHLVQNVDSKLPDYGDPAEHPGRIDINGGGPPIEITAEQLEELRALGYVPTPEEEEAAANADADHEATEEEEEDEVDPDFIHVNAVDWNPQLDQIAITGPELGEIWIFRRPTSSDEAASPAGDLIYRWGNPSTWGRGPADSKRLFYPHDVQWIPEGYPDAGQITIFNNGNGRPEGEWTSIEQIDPPLQPDGSYTLAPGEPYGPADVTWHYRAPEPESFYAAFISGAHRLPNGNTFVTSGPQGRLFEIDREGNLLWEFWNPWGFDVRQPNRFGRGGGRPPRRLAYGIWRAQKLTPEHPGLAGRQLEPLAEQPEHFVLPPEEEPETEGEDAAVSGEASPEAAGDGPASAGG